MLSALRLDMAAQRTIRGAVRASRVVRRAPVTVGFVALLWVVALASHAAISGPPPELQAAVGVGVGPLSAGHWWAPLTAGLWCSDLAGYLGTTLILLALVVPAERRLGPARTAVLAGAVQVLGTLAGVGVVALAAAVGDDWARQLADQVAVGPSTAAVGVGLALSARLSALWRRRLRLLILATLLMLVVYSGQLQDVLRLGGGLAGLLIGPVLRGGRPLRRPLGSSISERRVLVALAVAVSAVGPVIAAVSDTAIGPLSVLRFLYLGNPPDAVAVQQVCIDASTVDDCRALQAQLRLFGLGPAISTLLPVLLLLVLAEGLRLGRRAAWWGAVLVNVALATLGAVLALELAATPAEQLLVFGGLNATQAQLAILLPLTQPLLIAGLLLFTRRWFDVAAPAGTYRRLGVLAAGAFAVASTVYLVGGALFQTQFEPRPGLIELLAQLPVRFVPPAYLGELDPTFVPIGPAATLLHEWTGPIFLVPVLFALAATFRRSKVENPHGDRARARALLMEHGGSSLSFLTTWRGNNYWFSPDGQAVVAYRVLGTVALAIGDPVGAAAARAASTRGFARFCAANGWTPCLYGITEEVRADAAALGWYSVQVAEETVLMLGGLAFTGRKWQDVRTAMNNAEKAGIRAEWLCFRDAPFAITDQIRAISEEWIADKGLPEMGFTLGGL
ncbi:MAG: rhomboid family intrarane serine protease, partial [Pseudonocardia sp.]|nr:rhomboid family intrarane serine protease [Pseudonocardia sp.]